MTGIRRELELIELEVLPHFLHFLFLKNFLVPLLLLVFLLCLLLLVCLLGLLLLLGVVLRDVLGALGALFIDI